MIQAFLGAFVQVALDGLGYTVISVDTNGATGGTNYVQVVTLQGVTTDLATLLTNNQIDTTI